MAGQPVAPSPTPLCVAQSISCPEATRPHSHTSSQADAAGIARFVLIDPLFARVTCSEPPVAGPSGVRNLWKTAKITAQLAA